MTVTTDTKKIQNKKFTQKKLKDVKFQTGIIKFSKLYTKTNFKFRVFLAATLGLIMSFLVLFLVEHTGLYTGGVTALFQGIARMANVGLSATQYAALAPLVYNVLFWGLYLTFNIPLLIFAYKKLNKEFAIITGTYLFFMQVFGFVWAYAVPGLNEIMLFGDTSTVDGMLNNFHVQNIIFLPNVFPNVGNDGKWDWVNSVTDTTDTIRVAVTNANLTRFGLLLVYSMVFACCTATVWSLLYILGGCSAGTDITSIYYSQEKNKSLGSMIIIISVSCMFIGILLGSYTSGILAATATGVNSSLYSSWQYMFSGTLIASLLWVVLNGTLIDKIFPWHKLVKVEVYTDKIQQIRTKLIEDEYTHPTTIIDATGGYSQEAKKIMVTICMVVELPKLIKTVREVDEKCLISSAEVADIDGMMKMQKQVG